MPLSARRWFLLACGLALLLWGAAYANSLHNGFQFDDDHVIERNLSIRDLRNAPRFFTDARTFSTYPANATYRPLVTLTLALDYAVAGGLSPIPFHLTQLALFLGVGVLFFAVVRALLRLTGEAPWHPWAALLAAALFCLHTGNTQPANYLSARSELLCALGLLGAYLTYLAAPRTRRFHLYLLPMALGALGKSPAVLFAPLLLVHRLLFEEALTAAALRTREGWRRAGRALVATLPALAVGAGVFAFTEHMNPPGQLYGTSGRLEYLWTQASIWPRYLRLFVLPTGLTADTDLTLLPTWRDGRVLLGVLVLLGALALALRAARRPEGRPVALGIAWFWLGIAPTSSIVPIGEVTNDHRMFLGWLGLTLAVTTAAVGWAWGSCAAAPERRRRAVLCGALALGLLGAHAVGTHRRNRVWRDGLSLWADVVEKSPGNARGWMNYGLALLERGDAAGALRLFEHALPLAPDYPFLAINLGVVHGVLGHAREAEAQFQRALRLAPRSGQAHSFYARFLVEQGRAPEAEPLLRAAQVLDWSDPAPRHLLLALTAARGDRDEARALAGQTLQLGADPLAQAYLAGVPPLAAVRDDAQGWFDAGLTQTHAGQHALAAQAYRTALERDPTRPDAWNNLGWSLLSLGYAELAVTAFERTVTLRPDDALAINNLALARARTDRPRASTP
jgi:protein O-mannosyl-transferase